MNRMSNNSKSSFARLSIKLSDNEFDSDDSSDSVSKSGSASFTENDEEELKVPSENSYGGAGPV